MDLREIGWDMDWIDLAQDRDQWRAPVNMVMKLRREWEHSLTLKMEAEYPSETSIMIYQTTRPHIRGKKQFSENT
jgi:hypothetical protein